MPANCSIKEVKRCGCGAEIVVFVRRGARDKCRACLRRDTMARFKARNPDRRRVLNQRWAEANREKNLAIKADWQRRNPANGAAKAARYLSRKMRACPPWANHFFIEEAYDIAARRTRTTGVEHHVDHIIPLGAKSVCGLHWEGNLQILTGIENRRKGANYQGNA